MNESTMNTNYLIKVSRSRPFVDTNGYERVEQITIFEIAMNTLDCNALLNFLATYKVADSKDAV